MNVGRKATPEYVYSYIKGKINIKLLFVVLSALNTHFVLKQFKFEPYHEKTCFCHMRTTNAQISVRIRAV